jgi:hypothetical protein
VLRDSVVCGAAYHATTRAAEARGICSAANNAITGAACHATTEAAYDATTEAAEARGTRSKRASRAVLSARAGLVGVRLVGASLAPSRAFMWQLLALRREMGRLVRTCPGRGAGASPLLGPK